MTGFSTNNSETSVTKVRLAKADDVGEIFRILNWAILNTTACFDISPKSVQEQEQFFYKFNLDTYPIFVVDKISTGSACNSKIIGWSRLSPWNPKEGYSKTADISIYVDHECTGQGVGKLLLQKLIEHSKSTGIQVLMAQICEENQGSIRFHEQAGFVSAGTLKKVGIKFGRTLDVRIMQLHLQPS